MLAALLTSTDGTLRIEEIPRPAIGPGQVLVHVAAAPINPSDLVFLKGAYGIQKRLPVVPGFEGSGVVVEANAGLYGRWLVGQRVACRPPEDGNGTWADYVACQASHVIPLRSGVSLEQGATLIVNPLTAWSLMEQVQRGGHRAFIQTAAASAVGRMVARLSQERGVAGIHIVRRPEQIPLVEVSGNSLVLKSEDPDFAEKLKDRAAALGATIALDAVGGEATKALARAMPKGSRVIVYGSLSGGDLTVNAGDVIFRRQTVEGFWLTRHVAARPWIRRAAMAWQVQGHLGGALRTDIQARFPLNRIHDAIAAYKAARTQGKVLLLPSQ